MKGIWAAACALLLLVGCSDPSSPAAGTVDDPINLTVHSATSLTEVLPEIAELFMAEEAAAGSHIEIELVLGGSAGLATSISEGARSDVFVSASPAVMDRVVAEGQTLSTAAVTSNAIVLVVPPDDPAQIGDDLSRLATASVARCAPEVPCGALAIHAIDAIDIAISPRSEERNVRAVLSKVELGEVDAGFVYHSDAKHSGNKVRVVALPIRGPLRTDYTAAVIAGQPNSEVSQRFVDFLSSPAAQGLFAARGFGQR